VSPSISADGRYLAFHWLASNLVTGDTNGTRDVFVRDRTAGTTTRVSVRTGGTQANGHSVSASLSADGRYVAFASAASNLVTGDTNGASDVFLRDRTGGTTTRISVRTGGTSGNSASYLPSISGNGRYVGFVSDASNLVTGDTNRASDVFLRDRTAGTTTRVSVSSAGAQGNQMSYNPPAITYDGRYVGFVSDASNLVTGDTNRASDVFLRDRTAGTTTRVSVTNAGGQSTNMSGTPALSNDGRYVAFTSYASNLVGGDTNASWDAFVRMRS
jgi:Tol biopolymer transport system component